MSEAFDLIVVGAGPAGSSCARRAAELGLSVLVLEKSNFPRAKPCAAGLTDRALALLGGEEAPVLHRRLHIVEMTFGDDLTLTLDSPETLVATTTRREFDELLVDRARAAGAVFEFGRKVESLRSSGEGVHVSVSGPDADAAYAVLADGARGNGRAALGLSPLELGGAIYVRARPDSRGQLDRFSDRVSFDPTVTRRGYGWVFPKSDHLNVGVFSQRALGPGLSSDLDAFLAERGLDEWAIEGPFAHPVPVRGTRDGWGKGRVLLAGDAAGVVDPISGEGISFAVASGRAAAEAVAAALETGEDALSDYARRAGSEVVPGLSRLAAPGRLVYGLGPVNLGRIARAGISRGIIIELWRKSCSGHCKRGATVGVQVGGRRQRDVSASAEARARSRTEEGKR